MKRLLCFLLLLTAGCAEEPRRPHVILISMDTFRADRLGCYGNQDGLSPRIDEFAEQATRYVRAKASSPWTLPSHASLFTGLHPFEHGAHTYQVDVKPWSEGGDPDKAVDNVIPLQESFDTLAERLRDAGYDTGGVVANSVYLVPKYGCDQGFDHYEVVPDVGRAVVDHALRWLDGRAEPTKPVFLFLNFMDTHGPYNTAPREGWPDLGAPVESSKLLNELNDIVLSGQPAPPEALALLARQYDLAVANLDEQIGRLFDELRQRDLFEDAVIVLTSDHGEYLGEHRLVGHSKDVYEEAIAVPLIIKAPEQSTKTVDERYIGLAHVISRVAEHCTLLRGGAQREWPETVVLAENHFSRIKDLRRPWGVRFQRSRLAVYRDEYKLIHSTDDRHELYDLVRDPQELSSLAGAQGTIVGALQRDLSEMIAPHYQDVEKIAILDEDTMPTGLTEEEIERLKALGYF